MGEVLHLHQAEPCRADAVVKLISHPRMSAGGKLLHAKPLLGLSEATDAPVLLPLAEVLSFRVSHLSTLQWERLLRRSSRNYCTDAGSDLRRTTAMTTASAATHIYEPSDTERPVSQGVCLAAALRRWTDAYCASLSPSAISPGPCCIHHITQPLLDDHPTPSIRHLKFS
jgi:hypothetical protein